MNTFLETYYRIETIAVRAGTAISPHWHTEDLEFHDEDEIYIMYATDDHYDNFESLSLSWETFENSSDSECIAILKRQWEDKLAERENRNAQRKAEIDRLEYEAALKIVKAYESQSDS